jgi:hypothetical protein
MIRTTNVRALAAGLLLAAALPAFAASDYLLEIDGVDGEPAAKKSIEVQSFSWGASNPASAAATARGKVSVQDISMTKAAPRDAASGLATGKRAVAASDVASEAGVDAAVASREVSFTLPEAAAKSMCATGKHIAKATLTGRGQRAELTDVVVTSCTTQGGTSVVAMRGKGKSGHVTLLK